MTMAVCLKCGAVKHGAFTPCPECKVVPQGRQEQLASFMLTDWFNPPDHLEDVGQAIKDGMKVELPDLKDPRYARMVALFNMFEKLMPDMLKLPGEKGN